MVPLSVCIVGSLVGVGVGVGVEIGDVVGSALGVGVVVGLAVAVADGVGVAVDVIVGVAVGVAVVVTLGLAVGVGATGPLPELLDEPPPQAASVQALANASHVFHLVISPFRPVVSAFDGASLLRHISLAREAHR